jgi:hypothetical protein
MARAAIERYACHRYRMRAVWSALSNDVWAPESMS